MRTLLYVLLGIVMLIGSLAIGILGGIYFFVVLAMLGLPWIIPLYQYAPAVTTMYASAVLILAYLKRSRKILLLLCIAPGLYLFLIMPYEIAIWLTS